MFCTKCGKPLDDGVKFCTFCGAPVETAPVAEVIEAPVREAEIPAVAEPVAEVAVAEPVEAEVPVEETVVAEAPVAAQEGDFVEIDPEEIFTKPKKKWVKAVVIAACISAVAIVGAIAVLLNFSFLKGLWIKTFGTDQEYFNYVEITSANNAIDVMVPALYSALLGEEEMAPLQQTMTMDLTVCDEWLEALQTELGVETDLDFINDLGLAMDMTVDGDWQAMQMALLLENKSLLSVDVIMNMVESEFVVGLPDFNETYLDFGEMFSTSQSLSQGELRELYRKVLPKEEVSKELLKKYVKLIVDNITDVTAEEETVTVNGVEQKLTVLKCEISGKDFIKICKAVLKEAKKDKAIEDIINNFEDAVREMEDIPEDAIPFEGFYESFQNSVEEALESLDSSFEEEDLKETIKLYTYVDGNHQIVGHAFEGEDEEWVRFITVQNGKDCAIEIAVNEDFAFVGSGKLEGKTFNGSYTISVENTEYVVLQVKDVTFELGENQAISGKVVLTPTDKLMEKLEESSFAELNVSEGDYAVEYAFDLKKDTGMVEAKILDGNNLLIGVKCTVTNKEGQKITKPSDCIEVETDEDVAEWVSKFDFTALEEKLKDTDLYALIEEIMTKMQPETDVSFMVTDEAGNVIIQNEHLQEVYLDTENDETTSAYGIEIYLTEEGGDAFYYGTLNNVGEQLYFYIDGELILSPTISEPIDGGELYITVADMEDAYDLYAGLLLAMGEDPYEEF